MGSVITFYSFKGGVGRTMALANLAILLAKRGLRVLAVDADLEAPGLNRYFTQMGLPPVEEQPGLLELMEQTPSGPEWENVVSVLAIEEGVPLTVLTSGRRDESYARRVLEFNWEHFFRKRHGGDFFESLREQWKQTFDVVLIDSRTGITDSGGVFTIQLPDILVLVASPNDQSIQGVKEIAERAQAARQKLPFDRMPLSVLPILSRLDTRAEYEQARDWQDIFAKEMKGFYADWLPQPFTPRQMVEQTKLPYIAYFSFGEKLPVVIEGTSDPEGLGFAYEGLAALLAKDLAGAEQIVDRRDTYISSGTLPGVFDILIWAPLGMKELASDLRKEITKLSPPTRVFFDQEDLLPGDHVPSAIDAAVGTARLAVVVVSRTNPLPKKNFELEIVMRRVREDRLRLIPVVLGGDLSDLGSELSQYRALVHKTLPMFLDLDDLAAEILGVLKRTTTSVRR